MSSWNGRGNLGPGGGVVRSQKIDMEAKSQVCMFIILGNIKIFLRSVIRKANPQEAATPPPEAGPWGGSVMGGRNSAFSLPDRLAISGSWAS